MFLRIKHILTAYHLRDKFSGGTFIAICDCGWENRVFRRSLTGRARTLKCIFGHRWEDWYPVEVGGVYLDDAGEWVSEIDEGNGEVVFYSRQCDRCWKCETKDGEP